MAKYKRVDKSVFAFGEDAKDGQRYAYGTTIKTDDINDNLNSSFKTGWGTSENSYPAITDFNGKDFTITSLIAYLYQQGLAEYNENQNYYISSYCSLDGVIYRSLTGTNDAPNTGNNPKLSPNSWKDILEDYANINGNISNTFNVASATANEHAVNLSQLQNFTDSFICQPFYDIGLRKNCFAYDGAKYKLDDYLKIKKFLEENPAWTISEEDYNNLITKDGVCSFYGLNKELSTFIVPKFNNTFIKTANNGSNGKFTRNRMQNITGVVGSTIGTGPSGPFFNSFQTPGVPVSNSGHALFVNNFDASRVARTGDTTEPDSLTMILQARFR